jgi:protein-S-isoprenylcysteine O-methyltransferase Ste14
VGMLYIISGSMAFILFFLFDYYNIKNFTIQKKLVSISGVSILIYSAVMAVEESTVIHFSVVVKLISTVLFIVSAVLLIYSLFLELPFKSTYADDKFNGSLVDTGTYALCRHPGVLWLFFLLLFLFFMTGAVMIAVATIIWTSINAVYVYLQEKFFFCTMFSDYINYQKTTPMLIPNKSSIKKCIRSIFIYDSNNAL